MLKATLVLGLAAVLTALAVTGASAAPKKGPHATAIAGQPALTLSCSPCTVGGSLTVNGANFTPSSGGQQVILWVGYPNDYCASPTGPCHGFYNNPWVNADGSFSATFTNVLLQNGTGVVTATQYDAKLDKWVQVASATYTVQ